MNPAKYNELPVIVDLLPDTQIQNHPKGILVIGKFSDTGSLSMPLTEVRVAAIVQEIVDKDIDRPYPLSFYIPNDWQAFVIVNAVSAYFSVRPHVVMVDSRGIDTPLDDFYRGSIFEKHPIRKVVMQAFSVNGDNSLTSASSQIKLD